MASDENFVAFVRDQMAGAGSISSRKMFGEFAIYCDDQVVALVCDNQLFVKPTEAGKAYLGDPVGAPPFPGAKPYFLLDDLDDGDSLAQLIRATARELTLARPKASKQGRPKTSAMKKAPAPRKIAAKESPRGPLRRKRGP